MEHGSTSGFTPLAEERSPDRAAVVAKRFRREMARSFLVSLYYIYVGSLASFRGNLAEGCDWRTGSEKERFIGQNEALRQLGRLADWVTTPGVGWGVYISMRNAIHLGY
jgi:hypothetical protein